MWVKICGIRDAETAAAVGTLAPDAVGINFYPQSPRAVTVEQAIPVAAALPEKVERVGVFVNAGVDEIRRAVRECGLTAVQLHGDESAETVAALGDLRVIRAFRISDRGLTPVAEELERLRFAGARLWACLVDAHVPGRYGGTGVRVSWEQIREWPPEWPPLILAGGLTVENAAEAVRQAAPWGVDVAGGVESAPGRKDVALVRRFIAAARGR